MRKLSVLVLGALFLTGCAVLEMYHWFNENKSDPLDVKYLYYNEAVPGIYVGMNAAPRNWVVVEEHPEVSKVFVWIGKEIDISYTNYTAYTADVDSIRKTKGIIEFEGLKVVNKQGETLTFERNFKVKRMELGDLMMISNWLYKDTGYDRPYLLFNKKFRQ